MCIEPEDRLITGNRLQQELFNIGVKPNNTKVIHTPPPPRKKCNSHFLHSRSHTASESLPRTFSSHLPNVHRFIPSNYIDLLMI